MSYLFWIVCMFETTSLSLSASACSLLTQLLYLIFTKLYFLVATITIVCSSDHQLWEPMADWWGILCGYPSPIAHCCSCSGFLLQGMPEFCLSWWQKHQRWFLRRLSLLSCIPSRCAPTLQGSAGYWGSFFCHYINFSVIFRNPCCSGSKQK